MLQVDRSSLTCRNLTKAVQPAVTLSWCDSEFTVFSLQFSPPAAYLTRFRWNRVFSTKSVLTMPHFCEAQVLLLQMIFAHGPLNLFMGENKCAIVLFLTRLHSASVFSHFRNLELKKKSAAFCKIIRNLLIFALCIMTWL